MARVSSEFLCNAGSGDQNVAGTEQYGKRNEANYDAPEYAVALFLNFCLKHSDCFSL